MIAMFSYICQGDQMIRCVKNTSMYSNPLLTFHLCEVNTNAVFPNNICDLYYNHLHLFQSTVTAVAKLVRTIHFPKNSLCGHSI